MSHATSSTDPAQPPRDAQPCAWLIRPATGFLVCAAHPVATTPWSHPRDCDLPVASLCRVCSRTIVPIRSRFSWSLVCPLCRGVDSALAAAHRVPAMIPLEGSSGANRGTLYERLHPELADRTRRTETVVNRRLTVHITDDVPASDAGLELLNTFQSGRLAVMAAVCGLEAITLDPVAVGPGPFVRWEQWQEEFPASIDASARAYQALVCQVHPWIDSVEPRVADLGWLSALVSASRRSS